ncbi:MAG: DUF2079 domain-containing protein [Planctomycetes bacterium]|nr:DUF2079 domain-containing protein [Planctomycetota bacterium]
MPPQSPKTTASASSPGRWIGAIGLSLLGLLLASSCVQTWLSSRVLAASFVSPGTWMAWVGAKPVGTGLPDEVQVSFLSVATVIASLMLVTWAGGSFWVARRSSRSLTDSLALWGMWGAFWWCAIDLWEWTWIIAGIVGWESLAALLAGTPQFWLALCVTGWVTTLCSVAASTTEQTESAAATSTTRWVWLACGLYIAVFTTMNWRLYFNLLIPHGDSAMYEEHLWNVLHGKGFQSYLDQGYFLGEHIQFVHLFLIPIYVIWPSHLLLELTESTALAMGALPVYWMTRRNTGSDKAALAAAIAYLFYTPMQFLDIEIDLKTFRPEAFGIPLLLLTLDQLDRRNLRGLLIGLAFTLTVKEDYALIFGPMGLWILWHAWRTPSNSPAAGNRRTWMITGLSVSIGSVGYLWLATRVIMPWFRAGAEVHYARYFSKFGETPEQIVQTMLTNPGLLFGELFSTATFLYALAMLAPVAFLPLFSPGRLAVGAPLFGILCLNELAKDPRHQFHAPLVAIVFWAVAAGLPSAGICLRRFAVRIGTLTPNREAGLATIPRTLLWASALTTGVFFSLSPLGIPFWDAGSSWNWQRLYGPSRRAAEFVHVIPLIPQNSRVASTDFVHPRFTHYDRSYDYSQYLRKVSGYEQRVPDDTEFIVIDTQHPYSTIKRPDQIPELRDHPDQWELLPDRTEGYFIVLKRRTADMKDLHHTDSHGN